jgi:hypothetical protein
LISESRGGGLLAWLTMMERGVVPLKGTLPASISKTTTPRE